MPKWMVCVHLSYLEPPHLYKAMLPQRQCRNDGIPNSVILCIYLTEYVHAYIWPVCMLSPRILIPSHRACTCIHPFCPTRDTDNWTKSLLKSFQVMPPWWTQEGIRMRQWELAGVGCIDQPAIEVSANTKYNIVGLCSQTCLITLHKHTRICTLCNVSISYSELWLHLV